MYEQIRYEFIIEAQEPIAHHSESDGNQAVAFRKKVVGPDGVVRQVPIVTADTIRHGLREAGTFAYLDAAGLLDQAALTESALRLLFNGGMITGKGGDSGSVSLDAYRELVELIPHVGLLGGCARNRSIPGKVQVSDALLICEETRHRLQPWQRDLLGGRQINSHRSYIENEQRVRMDVMLDPSKRRLLTAGDQVRATGKLAASERASETGDAIEKAEAKSSMMPRSFERIAQGSLFTLSIDAVVQTPLERDALDLMVTAFVTRGRVGGKKGTGHGKIGVFGVAQADGTTEWAAQIVPLLSPSEHATSIQLGDRACGQMMRAHVASNKDRIKTLLDRIDA